MTGVSHVAVAAVATIILGQKTGYYPPGALGWTIMLVGSLTPDIDEPRSTASNPAGLFSKLVPRWVRDLINIPFQAISTALRSVFGHRGATHYLLWPIIFIGLGWYLQNPLLAWFGWGYLWHELADWITRMGIPAFGPVYRKNFSILPRLFRLKTGGPVEGLITTLSWLFILYTLFVYV